MTRYKEDKGDGGRGPVVTKGSRVDEVRVGALT